MQWITRYLGVSTVTSTKALSAAILISQSVLLHKRSLAARSTSFYPSLSFIYSELTNKVVCSTHSVFILLYLDDYSCFCWFTGGNEEFEGVFTN